MDVHLNIRSLKSAPRYMRLIDHLFAKHRKERIEAREDGLGLSATGIFLEKSTIARFLGRLLGSGQYTLDEPEVREIRVGKKVRTIHSYHLMDRLAQSALFGWLTEDANKFVSPSVYSYLPGRAARQAITNFLKYVREHRDADGRVDLFVFRSDLSDYTNSIPIGRHSALWKFIETIIRSKSLAPNEHDYIMRTIESSLRPVKKTSTGEPYQQCVGIPTGSSLTTLAGLLYLTDLDNALSNIDGGFYARYGDDILFAHPNWQCYQQGLSQVDSIIERLQLQRNPSKEQQLYYTKSGRRHQEHPELRGNQHISYLGYVIHANGSLSLPVQKYTRLLQLLRQRALRCAKLLGNLSTDEQGRALCQAINRMIHPRHPLHEPKIAQVFERVSSRSSLKELDYAIALMVAEIVSGIRGVKAWRVIPYRTIRQQWHLRSLCQRKNHMRMR